MNRNIILSILGILVLGFFLGGAVIAYFVDEADAPSVSFTLGTVEISQKGDPTSFDESVNGGKASWEIKNTGTKAIMLRVSLLHDSWNSEPGNDQEGDTETARDGETKAEDDPAKRPGPTEMPNIEKTVCNDGWVQGLGNQNNYWYYINPIAPNETVVFCIDIQKLDEVWEGKGTYSFHLEAEAVQASNDAIDIAWPENPFGS